MRESSDSRADSDQRSQWPDVELVRAAQRGDKRAFVELVARYQAMVCGIALGILSDFAASEDVGQEVFLNAWRKIQDLRQPERVRGWLGQIARNEARAQLHSRKPHEELTEDLDLLDESPMPDEIAVSEEETALVRASLARIPETYRLPLILYYREGKSVRAVAESLGISEDAAKQRLARGREMCRTQLSSVIETVLTRSAPSAIFTMSIAVAIGALAAPSAVAGSAFAVGSTAGSAGASSSFNSVLTTAMAISKSFILTTALVGIICVPIGYSMRTPGPGPAPQITSQRIETGKNPTETSLLLEDSELITEWRSLHEKYGTNALAMPALYQAIHGLKDAFHRQALGSALISEWAQVDPVGGLGFLMSKGHGDGERQQFFREWLDRDPQAALNGLMRSGDGWQSVAHDCLKDIAQAAPGRVAEIAALLPKPQSFWDTSVRDAFAVVAEKDLASARQAAEKLSGPNRDQALAGVTRAWAQQSDLAAVISWAKALPSGIDRDEILRNALMGKAETDPVAALEAVAIVPEGGNQSFFASTTGARVLTEAARTDFEGTVAWLASHPGRLAREDLDGLAGAVTDKLNADPAGFLTTHLADNSLQVLLTAINSALLNGSSGERGAVWDWLRNQSDSPTISTLKGQVLSSSAWQDPMFALQLAPELPNSTEGNLQLDNLANSLLNGGSMLSRFDQLYAAAPERLKTPLVESAFNFLRTDTLFDPQSWAAKLELLPSADRSHGVGSLAQAWAGQDPSQAIVWADSLQQGDARNSAMAGIASGWAGRDAYGAADWVASLPAGLERDKSSQALVMAVADQFPRDAWTWALSISDPTERDHAAARVIQTMAAQDPATARQWIDSGPFSTEERLQLQASIQNPGR